MSHHQRSPRGATTRPTRRCSDSRLLASAALREIPAARPDLLGRVKPRQATLPNETHHHSGSSKSFPPFSVAPSRQSHAMSCLRRRFVEACCRSPPPGSRRIPVKRSGGNHPVRKSLIRIREGIPAIVASQNPLCARPHQDAFPFGAGRNHHGTRRQCRVR
jgi:hypothetical protein